MSPTAEFSLLSNIEEKYVIADTYLIGFIGIILATYCLICVKNQLKEQNNKFYKYSIYCAILSFIYSIIVYLLKLFVSNDLLITHNGFESNKSSFVLTVVSLITFAKAIERLFLYYAFTFHAQSLTEKLKLSIFLKCWMIVAAILIGIACVIYTIDYCLIYTSKAIGIGETYDFHIAMYLGHEKTASLQYILFAVIGIQMIYVIYVSYLYITVLMQVKKRGSIHVYVHDVDDSRAQGVKGISLLWFVSIICCVCAVIIGLNLEIKYLFSNILGISDSLGLFLLLTRNRFYNLTCGRICNNCWIKILYGKRYHAIYDYDSDSTDEEEFDI
eukprot:257528_1